MSDTAAHQLAEARKQAVSQGLRECARCYITRGRREVLVFDHTPEYPDAGVQVPAGGVDPGETPEQAATREAFEESGLSGLSAPVYLGSRPFVQEVLGRPARAMRHYFWLIAPETTPDAWAHTVSAGEQDRGLVFLLRFAPLDSAGLTWDFDELLPEVRAHLARSPA